MRSLAASVGVVCVLSMPASGLPAAAGSADVAALQVALRAAGAYAGPVDGWRGPETTRALVDFQRGSGLEPDGIVGQMTRKALGALGRPQLGSRRLSHGTRGWDVAELQFRLAWHGFPSGTFDGVFGPRLEAAVRRFQRFSGLPQIGSAGPKTISALGRARPKSPLMLSRPVDAAIGDGFGPRGDRFHAGVDFLATAGTIVSAAREGRVVWAAPLDGFGNCVVISHGRGVRTLYAHLSQIDAGLLDRVEAGDRIGIVGSTGHATGPHLHFEVRVRSAAVDPLGALR
jgi:peptidoglycan hydrolase-like protein with peptidoglycan-binding domain